MRILIDELFDNWECGIELLATDCWDRMTADEKNMVRIGMLPARIVSPDTIADRHGVAMTSEISRKLALKLFEMTNTIGGMAV